MIDRDVFARMMRALGERIGKPLGGDASALYFAQLSEVLDTAEFQTAMGRVFGSHAYATWPAPDEIIALVRPSRELEALAAWQALEVELSRDEYSRQRHRLAERCGDTAVLMLDLVGGPRRWVHANAFARDEMRREFMENYGDLRRLPPPQREVLAPPRSPAVPGPQPLSALLPGISPYSPGDA